MSNRTLVYSRGDVISFTRGEYSDFGLVGFLVVVEPKLSLEEMVEGYKKSTEPEVYAHGSFYDIEAFPSWLIAKGYCLPVCYSTVHLGTYGSFDLERMEN